ncbi:MAG: transposase [Candidatus Aenigmarchaeota archaeon]|nr:transposase [Candidatus Aenigmarchaeota archaeon]
MPGQLKLQGKHTKEDFLLLYKKCRDFRLRERYQAMYLSFMYDWEEIAVIVGREYQTVLEWARLYNESGIEGLDPDRPPGRSPSLSKEQMAEVKKNVMQCPRDIGLRFSNWTVGRVCRWIAGKFNVILSGERVRQLLHAVGFSYVKPSYSYILADRKEREAFLSEFREIAASGTPSPPPIR